VTFLILVYGFPSIVAFIVILIVIVFGFCIKRVKINGKKVWICRSSAKNLITKLKSCRFSEQGADRELAEQ
jgi:hypothetical protein